jgi:hypothetical protein
MTVFSIQRDYGPNVSIVRIETDDDLENIVAGGWLLSQHDSIVAANNGEFEWKENDAVLVSYPTGNINATTGREIIGSILMYVFPSFFSLNPISPVYPNDQSIIAHAGGGQANATQVKVGINIVTTVATTADSVRLPNDVLGQTSIVINLGANSVNIFPWPGDSIDNGATDAAYALAAGSRVFFIGTGRLKWNSFGLATGS